MCLEEGTDCLGEEVSMLYNLTSHDLQEHSDPRDVCSWLLKAAWVAEAKTCHSCSSHLSQCSGTVLPSSLPPLFLPLTVCLASEKKSCAISTLSKCKHECFISLCSQTQLWVHTNWRTKVGSECPGALWLSLVWPAPSFIICCTNILVGQGRGWW